MINWNVNEGSAKIYQFPAGGPGGSRGTRDYGNAIDDTRIGDVASRFRFVALPETSYHDGGPCQRGALHKRPIVDDDDLKAAPVERTFPINLSRVYYCIHRTSRARGSYVANLLKPLEQG
jgi:hypothetical protein